MILGLVTVRPALAQEAQPSTFVKDVVKQVVLDPTTYAPAIISYDATIRDWNTSQPLFRNGYLERNPRYTVTGLPYDVPLSYNDGNRRIMFDTLRNLGTSAAHNAFERSLEKGLVTRYPQHRKLIGVLGWAERISFSVGMSYVLSIQHYRQAQSNAAQATALGLQ
jgi:hypothetical protein